MSETTTHRRRVTAGSLALICALPFLLVACTGQADTGRAPRAAAAGVGAAWGACMRDPGHDVQDPDDASVGSGAVAVPPGEDETAFAEASRSCAAAAGVESEGEAEVKEWTRQYARVASCIREHGYDDFPEQEPGSFGTDDYPRAEEPEFEEVMGDCMTKYSPGTQSQGVG